MTVPSLPPRAPQLPPPVGPVGPGERPTRPESVTIVVQLTIAAVVLQLIALPGSYWELRKQALTMAKEQTGSNDAISDPETFATIATIGGLVVSGLLLVVVAGGLLALLLRGKGWARFGLSWVTAVIAVMMIFDVFAVIFGAGDELSLPAWSTAARILGGVVAIGASVAAMHPDTRRYVSEMAD